MIPIPIRLGTGSTIENIGYGEFFCPNCNEVQPYRTKRLINKFQIYFIPLFTTKRIEYLECQTCRQTYRTEVAGTTAANYGDKILALLRNELRNGTDIREMYQQYITGKESQDSAVLIIKEILQNNRYRVCPVCRGVFLDDFKSCPQCSVNISNSGLFEPTTENLIVHLFENIYGDCLRPLD